jgi:hypothetical protein
MRDASCDLGLDCLTGDASADSQLRPPAYTLDRRWTEAKTGLIAANIAMPSVYPKCRNPPTFRSPGFDDETFSWLTGPVKHLLRDWVSAMVDAAFEPSFSAPGRALSV